MSEGTTETATPTDTDASSAPVTAAVALGERLVHAWGSWGPTMTPDAARVAFISDRGGIPAVWVGDVHGAGPAQRIDLGPDPVVSVSWSADSAWLSCVVATDGGVRTQVWVVRPDGTDARRLAGSAQVHAEMGPWTRSGHRVVVTIPPVQPGDATYSYLADPATGELHPLATGELISVLDLSVEERLVVLRDGMRGRHFCVMVDRLADVDLPLTPRSATGTTESAILRPAPEGMDAPLIAYLVTDVGLERKQLVATPLGPHETTGEMRLVASRDDAELEEVDADDAGRLLLLVWNVAGASELELLDPATGERNPVRGLPGTVASGVVLSRDGLSVLLAVESPDHPRAIWRLDVPTHSWSVVSAIPPVADATLVHPTLERYRGADGLELTGWLYRVPGVAQPGPAMLWLHGGPEAQERPTFSPQHQAMLAAGIAVFAPNVRGSSGFGRAFVHADEGEKRQDAFEDVLASARLLVDIGVADAERIAITGRSYGGYLTLAGLAFSPGVFAAGVDVCGMSDLHTFYRDTEPWIAAAAYSKYGHPRRDRALLKTLSPMRSVRSITAPLLVVHGELDTNVPIGEAHQVVDALRKLGRPVEYLELAGEGHEYRRLDSRVTLLRRTVEFLAAALTP